MRWRQDDRCAPIQLFLPPGGGGGGQMTVSAPLENDNSAEVSVTLRGTPRQQFMAQQMLYALLLQDNVRGCELAQCAADLLAARIHAFDVRASRRALGACPWCEHRRMRSPCWT